MIRYLPNILTGIRLLLIAPVGYFLLNHLYGAAVICFTVAALTDLFDGLLARRVGISQLGSLLDPLADKLLLLTVLLCLWHIDILAFVVVAAVVTRDLLMVIGVLWYRMKMGPYQLQPTLLGKWNTAMQLILLSFCLFWLVLPWPGFKLAISWLSVIVVLLVVLSAVDYIKRARRRQWQPLDSHTE